MTQKEWSGKTQGGNFGQKAIYYYFRYGSLGVMYGLLFFVIPFYMIFARKGYKSSAWYAKNCLKIKSWKIPFFVFRNFYSFGTVFLDRFAFLGNPTRKFKFSIENHEQFFDLLEQPKGFLIASAHVGNYEMLAYAFAQSKKKIYPVLYGAEAEVFQKLRSGFFAQNNLYPIVLTANSTHIFEINNALREGNIISTPADRTMGNTKTIETVFMGKTAKFPIGIFHLALTFDVPILTLFVMKKGYKEYKIYIQKIENQNNTGTKEEKIKFLCNEYVKSLEKVVHQYPKQWYNFYPFWKDFR